jgi:hypothetical protein
MSARLVQFEANLSRARDLVGLGQAIGAMTYGRVDASDLYRAALVHAVAALDAYVHAIVEDREVEIVMGRLRAPAASAKFGLTPTAVAEILADATAPGGAELTARKHIAQRIYVESYQRPEDIAAALTSVGIAKVWSTAFPDAEVAKTAVGLVTSRRNVIVHQCDSEPLQPGIATPLSADDAIAAINTVESTVKAIDAKT